MKLEIKERSFTDILKDIFQSKYLPAGRLTAFIFILIALFAFQGTAAASEVKQKTFATPDSAVQAMIKAFRDSNDSEMLAIFGPGATALVFSGDKAADKREREMFLQRYDDKNRLESSGKAKAILHVGSNDWAFPVPIVKTGARWRFDAKQGMMEILSRRIGENELAAIQTCLAFVDAEKEYATVDYDGNGRLEYAQKLMSTPGRKDGLYWEVKPGETPSPLGPLAAKAQAEGYVQGKKPMPYHGYFYRILTAQGKNAWGGAHSYIVKGKMIGGFAIVAYPAKYGDSGLMTFIVDYRGVVFEKDLGPKTAEKARGMKAFDPDATWRKAQ